MPTVSWPKMRGAECDPVWIFFRSVPQIPQLSTRMSTSPAANRRHRNGLNAYIVHAPVDRGLHGRG